MTSGDHRDVSGAAAGTRDGAVRVPVRLSLPPMRLTAGSSLARPASPPRSPARPGPTPPAAVTDGPTIPAPPRAPAAAPVATTHDPAVPAALAGSDAMAIRHAANAPGASPTPHAPPPHRLRANGALGLAIGIALLAIVFAIAVAMERTMHGFPPGTF